MRRWVGTGVGLLAMGAGVAATRASPPALQQMVETEKAFARKAAEVGVREAFLEYFADDSIHFGSRPEPYREFLRGWPSTPASILELKWEPRYGDVAASGDVGYLTGPAVRVVHGDKPQPAAHSCYFSVWKRQLDGSFKVFIDLGIDTPGPAAFAPGFVRASGSRYVGDPVSGHETLVGAERSLAAAAANRAPADVYQEFFVETGTLYRDGLMPIAGTDAVRWLRDREAERDETESLYAEAAASGDLGVTYGRYRVAAGGQMDEGGHYVRVWRRDDRGRWRVAIEVQAPRPPVKGGLHL